MRLCVRILLANLPESHAENDCPLLVVDIKAVLVEVQQLGLQQLGFAQGGRVVAPGDHSRQHQHTAKHACHHQRTALTAQLLLHWGTSGSARDLRLPGSGGDNLIHAEDCGECEAFLRGSGGTGQLP